MGGGRQKVTGRDCQQKMEDTLGGGSGCSFLPESAGGGGGCRLLVETLGGGLCCSLTQIDRLEAANSLS